MAKPSNKSHPPPTPKKEGNLADKLRQAKIAILLKGIGPIQIGSYNLDDAKGVSEYVKLLVKARHEGAIQDNAIFALHALIGDLIKIYLPQSTGTPINLTQVTHISPMGTGTYEPDEQVTIARAIKVIEGKANPH